MQVQTSTPTTIISNHGYANVVLLKKNNEQALVATSNYAKGAVIEKFTSGLVQNFATYLTVQIGENLHITLQPQHLQYINHSCNPNVFFNTDTFELVALKDIYINDELTFFYPSTEWQMTQPFECNCGHNNCLQYIQGAAFINKNVLNNYRLTSFIQNMLQQNEGN
ncbi:MAG: SET domain-containing protein-lysine N-methyltransferase [Chitinophagaceae bacterium]